MALTAHSHSAPYLCAIEEIHGVLLLGRLGVRYVIVRRVGIWVPKISIEQLVYTLCIVRAVVCGIDIPHLCWFSEWRHPEGMPEPELNRVHQYG